MNHEVYETLISAQLDGGLSPEEEAGLEEHLAVCPQCRAAKAQLEAVHRLLLEEAAVPPPGLTEQIMAGLKPQARKKVPWARRIAPLAAAAVVALVVFGVVRPSFSDNLPQEEYAAVTEAAPEESEDLEEAAPLTFLEEGPAEEAVQLAAEVPGPSGQSIPATSAPSPQASEKPAVPSSGTKTEAAPQTEDTGLQAAAVEAESLPAAPAPEESTEEAMAASGAEPAPEAAEPEATAEPTEEQAGGGAAEEEAISDAQPSSTLTWQQARDRLCDYLGYVPEDLTAQDMSPDGESWLFTAGGIQYAVDRNSGAVAPLGGV